MTRINSAINPKNLTDEHLLAEHREIKRICNNYYIRSLKKDFSGIPKEFTLGTGHVMFFINKPLFTIKRYYDIHKECLIRNFNVENFEDNWKVYIGSIFEFCDYKTTHKEQLLLSIRIEERLTDSKKQYWHYYGKQVSKQEAIIILQKNNFYE